MYMTYQPMFKEEDPITKEKIRKHFTDASDKISEEDISRIDTGYDPDASIVFSDEVEKVIHDHKLTAHNSI